MPFYPDKPESPFNLKDLISYETGGKERFSKLYMLPDRKRYRDHDNIANIVLQSCSLAVSRQMTIKHLAGDQVLREISLLVRQNMRQGDVFARYGGEEFIAILPDTDKRKAIELADRLRRKIQAMSISHENRAIKVTASFGVASLDPRNSHGNKLIQDADKMLYKAKLKGRNMVMPGLIKLVRPGRGATWGQGLAMGVM